MDKNDVLNYMDKISDEERLEIIENYCKFCGSKENPCFCTNDE